jgi:hypothetical protein
MIQACNHCLRNVATSDEHHDVWREILHCGLGHEDPAVAQQAAAALAE